MMQRPAGPWPAVGLSSCAARGSGFLRWLSAVAGCFIAVHSAPSGAVTIWPGEAARLAAALQGAAPPPAGALEKALYRMPTGALRRLLPGLMSSPHVGVRLTSARAALDRRVPGSTEAVQRWLRHPQAEFRRLALQALVRKPAPDQLRGLARSLGDRDESLRALAATALGTSLAPEASALLLQHLADPSATVRAEVVRSLALLGSPPGASAFVALLRDEDPFVRQAVSAAIGAVGDSRTAPSLSRLLSDPSLDVRQAAVDALAQLGPAVAIARLLPLLGPSTPPAVQWSAVARLIELGAAEHVVPVWHDLVLPEATVEQLFSVPSESLADELARCAAKPGTTSGALCLKALGYQRPSATRRAVLIAALDRAEPKQLASLQALRQVGGAAECVEVARLLGAAAPRVRAAAFHTLDALIRLPEAPGGLLIEPISDALSQAGIGPNERASLVRLLGRTASPRARAFVLSATRSRISLLRAAAAEALGEMGAAGAAALLDLLRDPSRRVRWSAALALRASAGSPALEILLDNLRAPGELASLSALAVVGPLYRAGGQEHVHQLVMLLDQGDAPRLDGIIEALAAARNGQGLEPLQALATLSQEEATLAKIAESLAALPESGPTLEQLSRSPEPWVRAHAVSSLGFLRTPAYQGLLEERLADRALGVVVNAAAALSRATPEGEPLPGIWCTLLSHPDAAVRGNAVAALRTHRAPCHPLPQLLRLLLRDPSERVRELTARLLVQPRWLESASAIVSGSLRVCERRDSSPRVARVCSARPSSPVPKRASGRIAAAPESAPATVLVVPSGEDRPIPGRLFVLAGPNGLVRIGRSDRRGATASPASEGPVRMLELEAL